ncbi:MAG: CopG family transcriptional regulator [Sandaracinaceae bacterium]|nr:CopG family transcriptional regulator [Sandaracinaceae bacterium]
MKRTVISLEERDKAWLDATAARDGTPATELVRRAVRLLRDREPLDRQPFDEILRKTRGSWRRGDGLAYQQNLRDEW